MLCVQVDRTRQPLTAMLADKVHMVPVLVDGRRGLSFQRTATAWRAAPDGRRTRNTSSGGGPTGSDSTACSLDIDFEGVSLAA